MQGQEKELGLKDYLAIARRRARAFFFISAPILTIGVALAFGLPAVYESTGTILFEQQEVPDYLVRATVTSYPDERIRLVTQRAMTADRLSDIITELNVYPEFEGSLQRSVSEMRSNLLVDTADDDVLFFREGAIAFTVTFAHPDPQMARTVASRLLQLYLDENQLVQEELAAETSQFFAQEAARLDTEISAIEVKLAAFKRLHADSLPELSTLNLQLMDRTERDLETSQREIRSLRERRTLLESELAQLSPYSVIYDEAGAAILSPQDRLKMLQRRYVQLSATYSPDHPDVLKTKREIAVLSNQTGAPGVNAVILQTELMARRDERAALRNLYSDDHPDVVRVTRIVGNLEAAIVTTPLVPTDTLPAAPADNPLYIQKQVQLEGTKIELVASLARRADLAVKLSDLEARLLRTPEVEREYSSLSRGYAQLLEQFNSIEQRQREAETARNLEIENKGERFTVLDPPQLPSLPAQPNRIAILLLTIVLAFTIGVGSISIAEVVDRTVRNARDVVKLLEIPPLAFIPLISNEADVLAVRRRRLQTIAALGVWVAVTLYFIIKPALAA